LASGVKTPVATPATSAKRIENWVDFIRELSEKLKKMHIPDVVLNRLP
jgi:hypothetical protein